MDSSSNGHKHSDTTQNTAPWAPSNTAHERPESPYWVPIKDREGHSHVLHVAFYPADITATELLCGRGQPFAGVHDVVRYALHKTLQDWGDNPDLASVLAVTEGVMDNLRDDQYRARYDEMFHQLHTQFDQHLADGQPEMGMERIHTAWDRLQAMPENDWKRKYCGKFKAEFGHLL